MMQQMQQMQGISHEDEEAANQRMIEQLMQEDLSNQDA
jgi:hypothetical protein